MDRRQKNRTITAEITLYNMFLTEAIFELLAERGIVTGQEVMERAAKLKNEAPTQLRRLQ
jgi:hypothetical protein